MHDWVGVESVASKALSELGSLEHEQKGAAKTLLAQAKQIQADFSDKLNVGDNLRKQGKFKEAIVVYEKGKQIWPESPNVALLEKGIVEARYGQAMMDGAEAASRKAWSESRSFYRKALELKPDDVEAQYQDCFVDGLHGFDSDELAKAKKCFERALEIKRDDIEAEVMLAVTNAAQLINEKKYYQAEQFLIRASELKPESELVEEARNAIATARAEGLKQTGVVVIENPFAGNSVNYEFCFCDVDSEWRKWEPMTLEAGKGWMHALPGATGCRIRFDTGDGTLKNVPLNPKVFATDANKPPSYGQTYFFETKDGVTSLWEGDGFAIAQQRAEEARRAEANKLVGLVEIQNFAGIPVRFQMRWQQYGDTWSEWMPLTVESSMLSNCPGATACEIRYMDSFGAEKYYTLEFRNIPSSQKPTGKAAKTHFFVNNSQCVNVTVVTATGSFSRLNASTFHSSNSSFDDCLVARNLEMPDELLAANTLSQKLRFRSALGMDSNIAVGAWCLGVTDNN